ncbi:MAG: histidine kinase [Cytophagales bacterium]|nr:histidine kinase [Cytophagales bacterium]
MSETFTLVAGTLVIVIITFVVLAFAYLIQRKLIQKERDYREIEQLLQSQELKSIYSLMDGQEQERKRIASDIHDSVGSMLATLKIYSDLVLDKEQNEELLRLNNKINEIAENLTNEIRKNCS